MHKKSSRGFTLIELMIMVVVLGVMTAVAVPKFSGMLRKSREGTTKGNLATLRSALIIYRSDNEDMKPLQQTSVGPISLYRDMLMIYFIKAMTPKYVTSIPHISDMTYHAQLDSSKPYPNFFLAPKEW